ncbi:MAG: hypothetical protein AB1916_04715 [Thermodesulfobacteriota bacterium]
MDYTEKDLPVDLKETEFVTLDDGTKIRYEESGGARDLMVGDEWTPRATIFPHNDFMLEAGGKNYRIVGLDVGMRVEKA